MRVSLTNNTKNKNHNGSCGFLFGLNLGYKSIPIQAYDAKGNIVWECELDIYGKVGNLHGEKTFIPFRFSGQYEDIETGLYYNRFRYYSPDTGTYISQDPIGLLGNNPNFYAYVSDVNSFIDPLGLMAKGIGVSMNTALTDVPNRGVHVNVVDGKRSMHIEIEGVKNGKNYNLNYKPADPTANDIMQKNSSKWNKITDSVDDFVSNPKNAKKLANIADAAAQNFPKNTKDFKTTATALKTICK
ncbi:RHS repeat domain-containing protein [Tenacibaculum maritimum]|uniref:RHS repeat domain-containing protein n=1 Tax=Tenacibaculum maritimum TaxID=107401 RepID=UPI0038900C90